MCWVWGLGSPAAEMESPGRFLGQPEPEGEKAECSFQKCRSLQALLSFTTSRGSPMPLVRFPRPRLAWTPHLEYGAVEHPQEK